MELMGYIRRTASCSTLYRAEKLESIGLNGIHHAYVLNICNKPGVSQDQLAGLLFVNKSNVARQLGYLEQEGFVTRIPDENDRRILCIFPTQRAVDSLPKIRSVLADWNNFIMSDLSIEEKQLLYMMMEKVMDKAVEYARGGCDK